MGIEERKIEMSSPLISVIIPVYQADKYLDECVQSVVNQTYKNLEIILVDDGSWDDSPELCDAWMKRDARIKVIHKENGGASSARNRGLDIAQGDYIGFIDSDDWVAETMYEEMITLMKQRECIIGCCESTKDKTQLKQLQKGVTEDICYDTEGAIREFLLNREISSAVWDKLFSKELWKEIRFPEGETNEEAKLMIPLLVKAGKIAKRNKYLHFYRATEGSVTSSVWKTNADIVLRNMQIIKAQIMELGLMRCMYACNEYQAYSSFCTALHLDKNFERINNVAKSNLKKYISIMRQKFGYAICSSCISCKDKILYVMIITRTLRPIYKLIGRM